MTERINARLDDELTRKLVYLRERTGESTTAIVRAALEAYYVRVRAEESPAALLSGFVGCGEGPADLSERYKAYLAELGEKVR